MPNSFLVYKKKNKKNYFSSKGKCVKWGWLLVQMFSHAKMLVFQKSLKKERKKQVMNDTGIFLGNMTIYFINVVIIINAKA